MGQYTVIGSGADCKSVALRRSVGSSPTWPTIKFIWCYSQVAKTTASQVVDAGSIPASTTNIGVSYNGSIVGSDPIGGGPIPPTPANKNLIWPISQEVKTQDLQSCIARFDSGMGHQHPGITMVICAFP